MHYLQPFLSPYTHPLAPCIPPFSLNNNPSYYRNNNHHRHHYVCAVERDSEFEFDPDKAREALRKLDQQFQSISEKKISSPKIRATEFDYTREKLEFDLAKEQDAAGLPEESLQVFVVTALLLFTVFYNVFFVTVIKPSVDGPDYVPAALSVSETPESGVLQQLSPSSGVSVEP